MRIQTLPLTTGSLLLACALSVVVAPKPRTIEASPSPGLRTAKPAAGLIFEPNLGQASEGVSFLARAPRYELALRPDRMTMSFTKREAREPVRLDMDVVNANPAAQGEGQQSLQSKTNYYVGNDPAQWRTGVPHFRQVRFNDVYQGVDLVYHPSEDNERAPAGVDLEYDFVVAPGVDPDVIQLRFRGHEQISVDRRGDLVLKTPAGELRHARPIAYQQIAGVRNEIPSRYRLSDMGTLGFIVGEYDHTQPLVIDPTVRDAQHVGGTGDDIISDIAICNEQNLLVTAGQTLSTTFLGGNGASNGGAIFVATFNNDPLAGTPMTLANFAIIDGNNGDQANAIAVDSQCNIFGTGASNSTDVPTTEGPDNAGDFDAFTFILNSDTELLFARRTGGDGPDDGQSIDLFEFRGLAEQKLTLLAQAGRTFSTNLPVPAGNAYAGGADAFTQISVFGQTGETLTEQSTTTSYHGGSGDDEDAAIRILSAALNDVNDGTVDFAFALGMTTTSGDVWPPENVVEDHHGGHDAAMGLYEGFQWSDGQPFTCEDATYIGSDGEEFFSGLSVRRATAAAIDIVTIIEVMVGGESIENAGYNPVRLGPGGGQDIHGLSYTFDQELAMALLEEAGFVLGGEGPDAIRQLVHDPNGCQVFSGISLSDGTLPITEGAPFPQFGGTLAGFVSRVCDNQLDFSTWVPGSADVLLTDVEVDAFGQIYTAGYTSGGFPVTPNSPPFSGPGDAAFIVFEAPFVTNAGLVNGASFTQAVLDTPPFELREQKGGGTNAPSGLSPQEIVTGFGVFIGPDEAVGFRTDSSGNAFLNLGGTEVRTNGNRSTMISASKLQTSFVLDVDPPADFLREAPSGAKGAAPETVTIQFAVDGDPSNTVTLPLVPSNPGLFALDSSGTGQGAILNPDFSVNGPDNPSASFVIAYGTGGGDVEPDCPAATLAPGVEPLPRLQLPQRILVDGVEANFNYAGSAPGLVCGVNQWNIIPTNNPSGPAVPIQVCSGDACSNIVTAAFE